MTAEAALQNLKKTMDDEQESQDDTKGMRMASCDYEILSWLYWVSLKIKADIRESPRHDVMGGIDQHHAEEVVPESLYLLLRLLCTDDDDQENMDKQTVNTKLLSIAQDIVFLASGGQRPTPKHIGIGVAVHQATRSKGLVQLLHAAGHSISYESVRRTDTAIANEAVKQYFDNGITRNDPARNRWSITYNERASLAEDTRSLFGLTHDDDDDEETHKDCLQSRIKRDNHDVIQLVDQFQRYNVFQQEHMYDLVSLTTGDVASEEILNDLTHAAESGKKTITELGKKRLGTTNTDFHASLTKRKPKTFSSLYSTDTKLEQLRSKCVKPDRDIFRCIIVSMESGREVNMDELLCAVPLSLATTDSVLRPTNKADLATILLAGAKETELSPSVMRTCTIIDGMALVRAMGKPHNASTFGEYADVFTQRVASNNMGTSPEWI
ncbi:hypothetical protein JOQ06_003533 [Pogonophryne albipinna]|uniref:Uncharacterized protein n=1 Tax=Pogonophryne albipinna TaxID=1090488 RepID=A0AAD6AGW4_9TELE|nr:hypothetical protein JOQ06_003533 [Pogonophryne albipinna]